MAVELSNNFSFLDFMSQILNSGKAEILTQQGKPSVAVLPAEQYEKLLNAQDYLESVRAIHEGLHAAENNKMLDAEAAFLEWQRL